MTIRSTALVGQGRSTAFRQAGSSADVVAGSTKRKQAEQERIQAGLRLIEVRNNIPQDNKPSGGKPGRPISPFQEWLRKNDIAESTARSLMKLAGSDDSAGRQQAQRSRRRSVLRVIPT